MKRIMFAIDREQLGPGSGRRARHQFAGDDERLFIGERDAPTYTALLLRKDGMASVSRRERDVSTPLAGWAAVEGVKPYEALRLVGRDIYIREGCVGCHSQQIRKLQSEVQRYGPYSIAAESVYDHPFLWGSKRTGPDLARVGQRYSDEWHRIHLRNPRNVVKESNMPAYPWLQKNTVEGADVQERMKVLRTLGVPYTDEEIAAAPGQLKGKTEEDAVVAYLQGLGVGGRAAAQQSMIDGGR